MAHKAETILGAIETRLGGVAATGGRVYRGRVWPIDATELPAILVGMGQDQVVDEQSNRYLVRELDVVVESSVQSVSNLEAELNRLRSEVFAVLMADPTLGGLAVDLALVLDQAPEYADQDVPIATQQMLWRALYRHDNRNAEV